MADESILDGLGPFELLDREAGRVHHLVTSAPDWSRPSRCAGWTVRDMLGHLMSLEHDFVEATVGRLPEAQPLEGPLRTLLSTVS